MRRGKNEKDDSLLQEKKNKGSSLIFEKIEEKNPKKFELKKELFLIHNNY